ncbi:MAG: prolipoprotein diacylglyceryl transferase [Elusimicrobia bacterium]|nr:prolipoprotein diacylglyceryl transferase [Elusimicrobiota bacterium]
MRPVLFTAFGADIISAPMLAGVSVLASYLYFRSRREALGLSLEDFWGLMLALFLGLLSGAVALYAALYGQGFATNLALTASRGRVAGGSYFGVFWGAAAAAFLFCRLKGNRFAVVADTLGGASLLGLVFMRLGCLLHGCCHGRPTSLPWGVVFDHPLTRVPAGLRGAPLHPTQAYEALGAAAAFLVLHFAVLPRIQDGRMRPGGAFILSAALYALLRFAVDFLRGSDPGLLAWAGLTTAQFLALLTLTAAAAAGALESSGLPGRGRG